MRLNELILDIETHGISNNSNPEINGICYDSRKVNKGDLFVCIKGFKSDGHRYAKMAAENGAVAIVAEDKIDADGISVVYTKNTRKALALLAAKFYNYPSDNFKLIGVTGTNGKTTISYLIKTILEYAGNKVGLIGTNQNMIGDKVIAAEHTTPESSDLQELFSTMASQGTRYVVMEVSSHALELERVAGLSFDVAVFSNLTQDHLDFHVSMQDYFKAKGKLFKMCKSAVINADDSYGSRLLGDTSCPFISYGIESNCDLMASDIKMSARGVKFNALLNGETHEMRLGIPGRFSVYNALAAAGAALMLGFTTDEVARGLVIAKGVKGRAEVVPINKDYTVIIDYAHTPDGLINIISTVREFAKGRVITLFGCGGDRDRVKRPLMGRAAGELSDFLIITSDNPRSEKPTSIIEEILPGVEETGCKYVVIENRKQAIDYALDIALKDDVIILAGKGHETYQILADGTIDFDERAIVMELLDKKAR